MIPTKLIALNLASSLMRAGRGNFIWRNKFYILIAVLFMYAGDIFQPHIAKPMIDIKQKGIHFIKSNMKWIKQ